MRTTIFFLFACVVFFVSCNNLSGFEVKEYPTSANTVWNYSVTYKLFNFRRIDSTATYRETTETVMNLPTFKIQWFWDFNGDSTYDANLIAMITLLHKV